MTVNNTQESRGQKHIYTYAEAVNCLLASFATDGVITKAALEVK